MWVTPSARPISLTVAALPLKENEEVRAGTRRFGTRVSVSISSSARPSEKYSWSCFSLRSVKGSTATDLPSAAAGGAAAPADGCAVPCDADHCEP